LKRMDDILAQIARRELAVADLTQRDDRILVIVAPNPDWRAGRNRPRAMAGHQDQIKSVVDLVDAILNGDTSHGDSSAVETGSKMEARLVHRAREGCKLFPRWVVGQFELSTDPRPFPDVC